MESRRRSGWTEASAVDVITGHGSVLERSGYGLGSTVVWDAVTPVT